MLSIRSLQILVGLTFIIYARHVVGHEGCGGLCMIWREAIPLQPPKTGNGIGLGLILPVNVTVIFETGTGTCTDVPGCSSIVQDQQQHFCDDGYGDIPFHFLVGNDGCVYEGRGWHRKGFHSLGFNRYSYGFAFIGTFDAVLPSPAAIDAMNDLIQCGKILGHITVDAEIDYNCERTAVTGVLQTHVDGL